MLVIYDKTSSGSKSAQELDYDYDCGRFCWFFRLVGFFWLQASQQDSDGECSVQILGLCVWGVDVVVFRGLVSPLPFRLEYVLF